MPTAQIAEEVSLWPLESRRDARGHLWLRPQCGHCTGSHIPGPMCTKAQVTSDSVSRRLSSESLGHPDDPSLARDNCVHCILHPEPTRVATASYRPPSWSGSSEQDIGHPHVPVFCRL